MDLQNLPAVSIIVVNHNRKKLLKDCFSSIYNLNYQKNKLEILMVDNISNDGSTSFVKKNFPDVKIIRNKDNNYAKANNMGIKKSKSEFITLLNNDTRVDKNWLTDLIKVITSDEKIGAVGSKILFENGRIQSTGLSELENFYWKDRGFDEEDKDQYEKIEEVQSLGGASILYRKKCLDNVGLLDEDFVMYFDDVDMSLRCRKKGWKLVYVPKSIVHHKYRGTADETLVKRWCERNRLLLIAKHYPDKLSEKLFKSRFYLDNDAETISKELPYILKKWLKHYEQRVECESLLYDTIINAKKAMSAELIEKEKRLQDIYNSRGWRFLTLLHDLKRSFGLIKKSTTPP